MYLRAYGFSHLMTRRFFRQSFLGSTCRGRARPYTHIDFVNRKLRTGSAHRTRSGRRRPKWSRLLAMTVLINRCYRLVVRSSKTDDETRRLGTRTTRRIFGKTLGNLFRFLSDDVGTNVVRTAAPGKSTKNKVKTRVIRTGSARNTDFQTDPNSRRQNVGPFSRDRPRNKRFAGVLNDCCLVDHDTFCRRHPRVCLYRLNSAVVFL